MGWEFTLLLVGLFIGIVVGVFINKNRTKIKDVYGILNIDCSDPADGPYLYLELTVPVVEVADCKRVVFNVNVISESSQK